MDMFHLTVPVVPPGSKQNVHNALHQVSTMYPPGGVIDAPDSAAPSGSQMQNSHLTLTYLIKVIQIQTYDGIWS